MMSTRDRSLMPTMGNSAISSRAARAASVEERDAQGGYWNFPCWLTRRAWWFSLWFLCVALHVPHAIAATPVTEDVWLLDSKVAVKFFDCGDLLCGQVVWLAIPRDAEGELNRDSHNPDIALRQRPVCGLTVLWALHRKGTNRWKGGWFYNPLNGKTYRVSAKLTPADVIVARIYRGIPLFGKTKKLRRVTHGTAKGWC